MFRVLLLWEGPWGTEVAQHIIEYAPPEWEVQQSSWDGPWREPPPDLLVLLAEGPDRWATLPGLAERIHPGALLAPVEDPAWFPHPARQQAERDLASHSICCSTGSSPRVSKPPIIESPLNRNYTLKRAQRHQ